MYLIHESTPKFRSELIIQATCIINTKSMTLDTLHTSGKVLNSTIVNLHNFSFSKLPLISLPVKSYSYTSCC